MSRREQMRRDMEQAGIDAEEQAKRDIIAKIMDAEGWTMEQTYDACIGANRVPKYSLYYKMASQQVIEQCKSKKGKLAFAQTLPEDEREVFMAEFNKIHVRREIAKQAATQMPAGAVKDIKVAMKNRKIRKILKEQRKQMQEEEE